MDRLGSKTGLLVALLAIVGMLAGCSPTRDADAAANAAETTVNEIVLTDKDDGRQIELGAGQVLLVSLESNPTTGYCWEVSGATDPVLRQVGEPEFVPRSDLLGAPGMETLRFQAAGAGETALNLVYHRPWEKGVEPLETFTLQVAVR